MMGLGRLVNLLIPIMYKNVVDSFGGLNTVDLTQSIPWKEVSMFVGIRFLAGSSGILQSIQSYLWVPVGQFTTRQVSVQMLEHLLYLSLRFHLGRKTGEILRVQDRGVASIVSLLSAIIFNIIPTLGGNHGTNNYRYRYCMLLLYGSV
jgi:ATP-binding cassette subfamily B (MDR/TAP) protein 6